VTFTLYIRYTHRHTAQHNSAGSARYTPLHARTSTLLSLMTDEAEFFLAIDFLPGGRYPVLVIEDKSTYPELGY